MLKGIKQVFHLQSQGQIIGVDPYATGYDIGFDVNGNGRKEASQDMFAKNTNYYYLHKKWAIMRKITVTA
ncbi:hypothetical protein GCM10011332_05930 [Terasakiella brassicae]|uniref:Uncharacterized protein n=1 Tax=Terasakiella brassicae TaxID=1634917 RepID=A0A917BSR4_9PROT|nr:hypothetical protein GCM10011332_05930 [Terasakiella brassicae]